MKRVALWIAAFCILGFQGGLLSQPAPQETRKADSLQRSPSASRAAVIPAGGQSAAKPVQGVRPTQAIRPSQAQRRSIQAISGPTHGMGSVEDDRPRGAAKGSVAIVRRSASLGGESRSSLTSFEGPAQGRRVIDSRGEFAPAGGLPNLRPFRPDGWSSSIVISTSSGGNSDSSVIQEGDDLFIDWAVLNDGNASVFEQFFIDLLLDGTRIGRWFVDPPLEPNFFVFVEDFPAGSLSAGSHTLTLVADSLSSTNESNENDNQFSRQFQVQGAGVPNLTPVRPSGWSDPVVVSTSPGGNSDSSPLTDADSLFIDWAVLNNGSADTAEAFFVDILVDGVLVDFWLVNPPLETNFFVFVEDFELDPLPAGTHTITLIADSESEVAESNESDNSFTRQVFIESAGEPDLTPFRPSGWSSPIVVSTSGGTNTDSGTLTNADVLFIDWAVLNQGQGATQSRFFSSLLLNGVELTRWFSDPPLNPNFFVFVEDFEIGPLPPGRHTLTLVADSASAIEESNEGNNQFTREIFIEAVGPPNLVPFRPSGWSDIIVISTQPDGSTDGTDFTDADTLFVDWAVLNEGDSPTLRRFFINLQVNGETLARWFVDPPLDPNFFVFVEDFEVGPLPPGRHVLSLIADSTEAIEESSESDNTFNKDVLVDSVLKPNLVPFRPSDWSDRIVISTQPGNNTDSAAPTSDDTLYIDWAVLNEGPGGIQDTFFSSLLLDGGVIGRWFTSPVLGENFFAFVEDFEILPLSPGEHTLELVADSTSAVAESDETDNRFLKRFFIMPAPAADPEEIFIYFPAIQNGGPIGTGIAFANPTDRPAEVEVSLRDNQGELVTGPGISNPARLDIPPNRQLARTVPELFGSGATNVNAWMSARSSNLGLVGFFLTLAGGAFDIDGAEAVTRYAGTAVFPELLTGSRDFTEINIVGTGIIDLELWRQDGTLLDSQPIDLGEGRARFSARVEDVFSVSIPQQAYVLARTRRFAFIGYESFGSDRFLAGRNAIPVSELGRDRPDALFAAQLADISNLKSTITLINPSDTAAQLTLSTFPTGTSSNSPLAVRNTTLGPRSMIRADARGLVGLPPGDFVGWLRVDSDVAGLVGDITFGDPNRNSLSSVQLQRSPSTDIVFSHLADGLGFSTGVTFLNTNPDPVNVHVEVFDAQARRTGSTDFVLRPFEHRPRTLPEIFGAGFQPQVGGLIRVTSDLGIFSFELFAFAPAGRVESLAAVPPQKGNGAVAGQLTVSSSGFQASISNGIVMDASMDFVPGEAVVRLRKDLSQSGLGRFMSSQAGQSRVYAQGADGRFLMRSSRIDIPSPQQLQRKNDAKLKDLKGRTLEWIEQLNKHPEVLYAEPNFLYQAMRVPNDRHYPLQWHYQSLNLPRAWDITTGSSDVIVAVIDTGAKFDHPDLAPRLTGGQYDFISDPLRALDGDGIDPDAEDEGDFSIFSSYHGTHVAGTVGAVTNNGAGVAGVNWVSPLMTIRVLGSGGGTSFDVSEGIRYAARLANSSGALPSRRADVINMSLGGPGASQAIREAVEDALAAGVTIVAAAGNDNTDDPSFPASFPGVISVGATDLSGGKADYSNFGSRIDVVAPGGDTDEDSNDDGFDDGVLSTLWSYIFDEPRYDFYQGTSMASPHVAGIASLVLAVNPGLTPQQLRRLLQETAIDLGDAGRDNTFGFGLVNAVSALQEAGADTPQTPVLLLSTEFLNFGLGLSQLTVTISNGGGGNLSVDPPSVQVDQGQGWLSAALGSGGLLAAVNRTGLPEGIFTGRIHLTSNGGDATVEVRMQVGAAQEVSDTIFVLALDPVTFETIEGESTESDSNFQYRISPLPSGEYIIVAGTDRNDDGFICDQQEDLCGFFPVSNRPTPVQAEADQVTGGINFSVARGGLSQSSAGKQLIPERGIRIVRRR